MTEKRTIEETPFEAGLRSAIMQSGRTFDDLEETSGVTSQAIGRFVSGTRGLTTRSAGRLMDSLNLIVLCVECHEKHGKRSVRYEPIEILDRPPPKPPGRPSKIAHHGSSSGRVESSRTEREGRGGPKEIAEVCVDGAGREILDTGPITARSYQDKFGAEGFVPRKTSQVNSTEHIIPLEDGDQVSPPKKRGRPTKSRPG